MVKMINIKLALKSNRIMKSLTGLNTEKFKELLPCFNTISLEENKKRVKANKNRKRTIGGGIRLLA